MSLERLTLALAFLAVPTLVACSETPSEPQGDAQSALQVETLIEGSEQAAPRPGPAGIILRLADELGLSSGQRSAIEALGEEHRQARRDALNQVRRVLTDEQSARLREILSERTQGLPGNRFSPPEVDGSRRDQVGVGPAPMLRVLELADELDLTRQQIAELETILAELQVRTREIREAIRNVLTPAQLDHLKELLREGRGPMGRLHGGG